MIVQYFTIDYSLFSVTTTGHSKRLQLSILMCLSLSHIGTDVFTVKFGCKCNLLEVGTNLKGDNDMKERHCKTMNCKYSHCGTPTNPLITKQGKSIWVESKQKDPVFKSKNPMIIAINYEAYIGTLQLSPKGLVTPIHLAQDQNHTLVPPG
ncbi:hypothetical protein VNO77_05308 [Canavalia gladiata]|uniref:Uncharacterized protein n=1 Tax=Canavalia gladiata TaxID=3824 RepID=A0AAN9MYR4_CANGL